VAFIKIFVVACLLSLHIIRVASAADDVLTHQAVVPAPVADVWAAFTTSDGLSSWMAPKADIDLRVGGLMRATYDQAATLGDDSTIENTILSFLPQRMLSIRCTKAPASFPWTDVIADTWSVIEFDSIAPDRTMVRFAGMGYDDADPRLVEMKSFFKIGNQQVIDALVERFGGSDRLVRNDARVIELLSTLAGGEWIHESTRPDGSIFRVRNVITNGPDGLSTVTRGWLGGADGMFDHAATLVFRLPQVEGGGVAFAGVHETGGSARGVITLHDDTTVIWHWPEAPLEGDIRNFRVHMTFDSNDDYTMRMHQQVEDGSWTEWPAMAFRHVEAAPPEFTRLRAASSTSTDSSNGSGG
jgi:uncharacterized protein YndB with AHSA1/START domain